MKSNSKYPSPKDLKYISKIILQDNHKLMQNMEKEVENVIIDKGEEIYCLKNHSRNLIA